MMRLYFTPLLLSTPPPHTLCGVNSCCSLMNLVWDFVVHIFLKTMATAIYIM